VRIILEDSATLGRFLRGLERWPFPPPTLEYSERLVDLGFELQEKEKTRDLPYGKERRFGLLVSVRANGLDEPIDLRVWPADMPEFANVRELVLDWARRPPMVVTSS
jgi:hypothetical protein